ncbi:MAG TPA: DUF4331 domain-containing protein [Planctomycetota bacterium]|nr:DUF4331 domain-containing protein [Planctomycetota bacterium]
MYRSTCLAFALVIFGGSAALRAANHREAPITALDHKADITDIYAFVSYSADQAAGTPPSRVTLILGVDPLLEPANGPTLFPFDPDILYEIKVDNDQDAEPDVIVQFRFNTEYQLPDVYTAVAGIGDAGANAPGTSTLVVPPRIESFDNPGLNLRQTYRVSIVRVQKHRKRSTEIENADGAPFFAVPGNAGPRTMDYSKLYKAGTYHLENGMSVFAGTTDDAFWIDLGAAFDTASFRTLASGVPGVLTAEEDAAAQNFASDTVSGYAVNSIAIELPIEMLTRTGNVEPATSPDAVLGIWGTTSRERVTIRRSPKVAKTTGSWRQVQRMGNPLINELIIGIGSKDRFSMDEPRKDMQFASFFLDPPIVRIVEALYGGALAVPKAPRTDLLPLVTYAAPIAPDGTQAGPIADLLRLNSGVSATPLAQASRLGLIGGDPAGFPNGRRVYDDVTDVVLRVGVGGVLNPTFDGYQPGVNDRLGDGVNVNDTPYPAEFPYLGLCPDGRNRRHIDPGEVGGGPVQ